jgi:hypothetical protein
MNNKLLFFRSLIAACTIIMQFWIIFLVFNNDYICRSYFTNGDSSDNQKDCIVSSSQISQWHCTCKYFNNEEVCSTWNDRASCVEIDFYMRVFDDGTLALASFIFIPLIIIEIWRSFFTITRMCNCDAPLSLITFDYCSIFGFITILLNPSIFDVPVPSTHIESLMILIDAASIGLIFQYSIVSKTSIHEPFMLVALVLNCCDSICYLLNMYILNRQIRINKQKNINEQNKKSNDDSVPKNLVEAKVDDLKHIELHALPQNSKQNNVEQSNIQNKEANNNDVALENLNESSVFLTISPSIQPPPYVEKEVS